MLKMFRKGNQKGFTLIELLIVVAIIGILAAIAIPQFAAYRQRAYNSSALSDLRTSKAAQESLWADNQSYGAIDGGLQAATALLQAAAPGAGAATYNGPIAPATANNLVPGGRLAGMNMSNVQGAIPIGVSNGVNLYCAIAITAAPQYDTYVMAARHNEGDTAYGADSDNGVTIYRVVNSTWPTVVVNRNTITATVPVATSGVDNFATTPAGGGAPTANWAPM